MIWSYKQGHLLIITVMVEVPMILSAEVMKKLVAMKTKHVTFQEMYLNNGYGNGDENGED